MRLFSMASNLCLLLQKEQNVKGGEGPSGKQALPLPASRKGLRLPLRSALFGEGGRDWRPCLGHLTKMYMVKKQNLFHYKL